MPLPPSKDSRPPKYAGLKDREIITDPKPKERQRRKKQAIDEQIEKTIKRINKVKAHNPVDPAFLGLNPIYPARNSRWRFRIKKTPDLDDIRGTLTGGMESKAIYESRKTLVQLLKKFPYDPNVRVLRGVQLMNDTFQSALDADKMLVLKRAYKESATALYNNGLSVFNVTWTIKIYLKFIESLFRKASNEYRAVSTNFHFQIRQAADELNAMVMQLSSLLSLKKHMSGLAFLNNKLKGTAYMYDCITKEEIMEATQLMASGDNAKTESGRTANYIVWVSLTLASILARIPTFHKLIPDILNAVHGTSTDLKLQKVMVGTIAKVTEYQLKIASGDSMGTEKTALYIYKRCEDTIKEHLENINTLRKTYEIDPFIKAAWITKDLQGLIEPNQYRPMLEKSHEWLTRVLQSAEDVKDSIQLATKLSNDIETIMSSYGWSPFEKLKASV